MKNRDVVFVKFKNNIFRCTFDGYHVLADAFSGLMNTVQQPASEVTTPLLIPKEEYQKASGLQSLSRFLISILNPLFATALYGLASLELVIALDLGSFIVAFLALFFNKDSIGAGGQKGECFDAGKRRACVSEEYSNDSHYDFIYKTDTSICYSIILFSYASIERNC